VHHVVGQTLESIEFAAVEGIFVADVIWPGRAWRDYQIVSFVENPCFIVNVALFRNRRVVLEADVLRRRQEIFFKCVYWLDIEAALKIGGGFLFGLAMPFYASQINRIRAKVNVRYLKFPAFIEINRVAYGVIRVILFRRFGKRRGSGSEWFRFLRDGLFLSVRRV
jgi:hypothetical protein